ncbi:MAG TPA: hypothetical protein VKA84_09190 [Gemmatimonadaceae bacterium]|nr:hypothetical protein [Gemmatimonadaceae bacterium]
MRRVWVGAIGLVLAVGDAGAQGPPRARRDEQAVDVLHGVRVPDPYRWLEEMGAEDTKRWVEEQDAYARRFAAGHPGRQALRDRLAAIASAERLGPPVVRGGRHFMTRFGAGGPGASSVLLVRDGAAAPERVLVAQTESWRQNGIAPAGFAPSPDGRLVAYTLRARGSNWMTLRVRDVTSGRDLADSLVGINGSASSIAWHPDGRALYYGRFDVPAAGAERQSQLAGGRVMLHRLGSAQAADSLVFDPPAGTGFPLSHAVSDDGRYLVISATVQGTPHNRIYVRDLTAPRAPLVTLFGRADGTHSFVGSDGETLWFLTDHGAPRGRVVAVAAAGGERLTDLIPEAPDAVDPWIGASAVGGRIIVGYRRDVLLAVTVFDARGRRQ